MLLTDLPKSLTHLTFGNDFNQEVSQLHKLLTHLTFGYDFNQDVSDLPKSLTHLTFDRYSKFNQKVSQLS
jgi:hypothetical protein